MKLTQALACKIWSTLVFTNYHDEARLIAECKSIEAYEALLEKQQITNQKCKTKCLQHFKNIFMLIKDLNKEEISEWIQTCLKLVVELHYIVNANSAQKLKQEAMCNCCEHRPNLGSSDPIETGEVILEVFHVARNITGIHTSKEQENLPKFSTICL